MVPLAAAGLSRLRAGSARLRPHRRHRRDVTTTTWRRSRRSIACATCWRWSRRSGHRSVAAVVGHDFGSPVAGWCALTRPDVFRSVVMMSAPFGGTPRLPFNTANATAGARRRRLRTSTRASRRCTPPRKHYQPYYTTREANENMWQRAAGRARLPARLLPREERRLDAERAASAGGQHRRGVGEAAALLRDGSGQGHGGAGGRRHAVRRADRGVQVAARRELAVYAAEYGRTGFQGGLQSYRVGRVPRLSRRAPAVRRAHHRRARGCSSRARATGASISAPGSSRRCRRRRARSSRARTWSTAPATGCSRSSRRGWRPWWRSSSASNGVRARSMNIRSGALSVEALRPRTAQGIRIVVVDSGVHPLHPHIGGVENGVSVDAEGTLSDDFIDRLGHGTAVTAAIREKAPQAEILVAKVSTAASRPRPRHWCPPSAGRWRARRTSST